MTAVTGAIAVMLACLCISTAATALRFWARLTSGIRFRWSALDVMLLLSLGSQTTLCGLGCAIVLAPPGNSVYITKLYYAGTFAYLADLWFIKLSINLFHLRLTHMMGMIHKLARYCLGLIVATFIVVVCLSLFQCVPISQEWHGGCNVGRQARIFWTTIILNISTDIILCILPFPALMRITEKRIRVIISCVFALAGLVVIVSLIRAIQLIEKDRRHATMIIFLSHVEVTAALVISAVPGMSKYFTAKYLQSTQSGGNSTAGNVSSHHWRQARHSIPSNVVLASRGEKMNTDGFVGLQSLHGRDGGEADSQRGLRASGEREV